jgi:phage shock protein A
MGPYALAADEKWLKEKRLQQKQQQLTNQTKITKQTKQAKKVGSRMRKPLGEVASNVASIYSQ